MEEVDRQSVLERDLDSLVDASILQFEIVLVATVSSQIVLEFHGVPSELALIFQSLDTLETEGAFSYRPAPLNMKTDRHPFLAPSHAEPLKT